MILEFSVENYRSFREKQTFSMIPDEGKTEFPENIFSLDDKYSVLRSAVIYGANASGKSNFMRALQALRYIVAEGADKKPEEAFSEYDPYKFNSRTATSPVVFDLDFMLQGVRYTYHVSLLEKEVMGEWLFFYPEGREAKLFVRTAQEFDFGDYLKGQKAVVASLTAKNQLFLSKAAKNNISQLMEVYLYFGRKYKPIPFLDNWVDRHYNESIAKELMRNKQNEQFVSNFKTLLKTFDTGVLDFNIEEVQLPLHRTGYEITVEHPVYNDAGQKERTTFQPFEEESTGTQKLFILGGLILRAIQNGQVIMVDEFERSLHPMICSFIISLFHNPKINTKGAQLIIATHDTNLLSGNNLRRDQIWIVEKDKTGASELFSLADMKGILKDAPYEKWYLSGRFGGVPGIESLNFELNFKHEKEQRETADI